MLTRVDHVMICVPDLAQGIDVYRRMGFNIYPGGVHTGKGTHNAIAFHQDDYLELLALRDQVQPRANQAEQCFVALELVRLEGGGQAAGHPLKGGADDRQVGGGLEGQPELANRHPQP